MFGIVADNELYLKVDAQNRQDYEDLGLQAFSFGRNGKEFKMSYYQAPLEAMEDGAHRHSALAKPSNSCLWSISLHLALRKLVV